MSMREAIHTPYPEATLRLGVGRRYSIRSITSPGKIIPGVREEMGNFSGSCVFFGGIQRRVCFGS